MEKNFMKLFGIAWKNPYPDSTEANGFFVAEVQNFLAEQLGILWKNAGGIADVEKRSNI